MHINPDHFLQTEDGRVTTPERNSEAWVLSYAALDKALSSASGSSRLYVMVGPQGAGKSSWARIKRDQEPDAIIFDAILVKKSEREPLLIAARRFGVQAVAVVLDTPLQQCIHRNARRPADEVVPEQNIRNVFAAIEPPSLEEGFVEVIRVPCEAP